MIFWGCISIYGVGPLVALEGSQNQHTYKDLLNDYLIPEIEAAREVFGVDMTFMQDNAPCHKTNLITDFLADHKVKVLDWPPQSPDLNPIENLWSIIKQKRSKKFGIPSTKGELIEQIFQIWDDVDVEFVEILTKSKNCAKREILRGQTNAD